MSWLDDLARKAAGATGKAIDVVGSSVGGLNPNQSFGNNPWVDLSSTLQNWGGNPGSTLRSAIVRPARASDGYSAPGENILGDSTSSTPTSLNTDQEVSWTPSATTYTSSGGDSGSTDTGGIDLGGIMDERRARNEGSISSFLGGARGLKDEILGMVGKKRGQYEQLYNEGDQSITQTFEGEKGNARRTFNDLTSIEGNRARALGLGGSATDYASSRRSENLGRTLGDVNTNATNNRMENKRTRDARMDQADSWENQALRDYGTAESKAQDARNSMLDQEENTVLGWLGNILQNQLSLNATKAGIGADVANPYAVDTSGLTSFLNPTLTGGAGATGGGESTDGVNLADPRQFALLQDPKKLYSGLYGARA